MSCQKCGSSRIFSVYAKCSDLCTIVTNTGLEHDGYVPQNIGISTDSDAVNFDYCIDCGQIQGTFPINFSGKFVDDEDDLDDVSDVDPYEKLLGGKDTRGVCVIKSVNVDNSFFEVVVEYTKNSFNCFGNFVDARVNFSELEDYPKELVCVTKKYISRKHTNICTCEELVKNLTNRGLLLDRCNSKNKNEKQFFENFAKWFKEIAEVTYET